MIVYHEFRMLRDIITEIGEERDMIGNLAVKDFFEDLRNHYYDFIRIRECNCTQVRKSPVKRKRRYKLR